MAENITRIGGEQIATIATINKYDITDEMLRYRGEPSRRMKHNELQWHTTT